MNNINKELLEKAKNNLALFKYMSPELKKLFRDVGIENCEVLSLYDYWRKPVLNFFDDLCRYRVKEDYQGEENEKYKIKSSEPTGLGR